MNTKIQIGILSLQGCVEPHRSHFENLGCEVIRVLKKSDFEKVSALVLPGGESTTHLKLLKDFDLEDCFVQTAKRIPYWGICAGSILMAEKVTPDQKCFGIIPIEIQRNAYGRQQESFVEKIKDQEVAFIRAPMISRLGAGAEIVAEFNNNPVWVTGGKHMVTTFHPELSFQTPSVMHRFFVERIKNFN